jgi:hypothetical protein
LCRKDFFAGLLQVEKAFERAFADSKAFSNLAFEKPLSKKGLLVVALLFSPNF